VFIEGPDNPSPEHAEKSLRKPEEHSKYMDDIVSIFIFEIVTTSTKKNNEKGKILPDKRNEY
jgi:hypothetical protein